MPKPVLQAMVLADQVYQDRLTGKFIIAGTFGTIFISQTTVAPLASTPEQQIITGPITRAGSPYLYLALVEVHGQIRLSLKFVDLSDSTVLFEAQVSVGARDPVEVAEYCLPMPPLPTNKIGNYSLDLLYEDEIIGSWRVSVKKFPTNTGEAGVDS